MNAVANVLPARIRPMQLSDIAGVMAIERQVYEFPWTEGIFRDCLRVGYCCWACENDAGVAGYTIVSIVPGEAHLLNLCVSPEYQRRGLGHRMLEHVISLAGYHQAERVLLEVRPSNEAAIALYQRFGFKQIGIRKGYYPAHDGREDALVLAVDVTASASGPK